MKSYFITGVNRGIGLELVRQLLSRGEKVYGTIRTSPSQALEELRTKFPDQLVLLEMDVLSEESVNAVAKICTAPIDVLINSAGAFFARENTVDELDPETVRKTLDTNTLGPIRVTKALLPALKKSKQAKIIHISSLMGSIADNTSGGAYAYRISKAALNAFNKSLSFDVKSIPCLVLHPGWVKTDMGGQSAPVEIPQSVEGILKVIDSATVKDTGGFFDFRGKELPW